jgi:hypothetical protein
MQSASAIPAPCTVDVVTSLRPSYNVLDRHSDKGSNRRFSPIPQIPRERLDASLNDHPLDSIHISPSELSAAKEKGKTVLYLAYGSNLCAETFRGRRGIKPLGQVNVVVPELRLTFDLPGFPYTEPCFANSAYRDPSQPSPQSIHESDYHKDRWHKGMVGCVYEVSLTDYAHIIATEGGGSSYQDILVTCYPLSASDTVPTSPTTQPFKAHTLFAPPVDPSEGGWTRPDPSYAQPSARYLKLLTDGAVELSLPIEYQKYLLDIRPYTITTKKQAIGKATFSAVWMPFFVLFMWLQSKFQDDRGRAPKWLSALGGVLFVSVWRAYDTVWKPVFGDGERTIGQGALEDERGAAEKRRWGGLRSSRDEEEERLLGSARGLCSLLTV